MSDSSVGKIVKWKETVYVKMCIQDDICQAYFKPIKVLDLAIAKITVHDRIVFFRNKSYPCLFDVTQVNQITKEARDYMAAEGNQLVVASAMLINSPMLRMIANFYMMVSKPKNPTQLFTDKHRALEWLKPFRDTSFV
ncbi:hypothetical protein HUW51_05660 [Adhaeribacter swui]|uniref:DUF7793 domain-containing protein n=1 Tax=Adhaeribacter swui TaxID=2086471 RepID=A0A7G7G507_9BACT|nr:hypothetical protein [Adhaeribacter swui]QNF32241.1 hypothetical protein HUW51_05660 [Adhaeribacter swui]